MKEKNLSESVRAHTPLKSFQRSSRSSSFSGECIMDGSGRDHMHAAIQEDQREHPQCSYSTVRSHFSSFLNGSSKAETLTKIIRNCQGEAPVEIYRHKQESDEASERGEGLFREYPHQRGLMPPLPWPGVGSEGSVRGDVEHEDRLGPRGSGAEGVLAHIFGHMLDGALQNFSGGRWDGNSAFGDLLGKVLPPLFPPSHYDEGCQRQEPYRVPRPPHLFPRGRHQWGSASDEKGDVTEI